MRWSLGFLWWHRDLGGLEAGISSTPDTQWWLLSAVAPQLLVAEGLGQVTTLVGQSLYLPCYASGSPVPTIQCVGGGGGQNWVDGGWAKSMLGGVGMGDTPPLRCTKEATEPGT